MFQHTFFEVTITIWAHINLCFFLLWEQGKQHQKTTEFWIRNIWVWILALVQPPCYVSGSQIFNMHQNHLGGLVKPQVTRAQPIGFWFTTCGMGPENCISYKFLDDAELYTFEQIIPYFESQILWLKKLGSFYLHHKHSFPFPCIEFHNSEAQAFQKTELMFFLLNLVQILLAISLVY